MLRENLSIIARTANPRWASVGESARPGQRALTRDDVSGGSVWQPEQLPVVNDRRADEPYQWPLSKHAIELHEAFLRRHAFLLAIHDMACPVETAGLIFLNKKKRQTYTILHELNRHASDDDYGALGWLRHEALLGFEKKTICPGRETITSSVADSFYIALGGGKGCLVDLYRSLLGEEEVEMRKLHRGRGRVDREQIDYMVYSHLLNRYYDPD